MSAFLTLPTWPLKSRFWGVFAQLAAPNGTTCCVPKWSVAPPQAPRTFSGRCTYLARPRTTDWPGTGRCRLPWWALLYWRGSSPLGAPGTTVSTGRTFPTSVAAPVVFGGLSPSLKLASPGPTCGARASGPHVGLGKTVRTGSRVRGGNSSTNRAHTPLPRVVHPGPRSCVVLSASGRALTPHILLQMTLTKGVAILFDSLKITGGSGPS